MNMNMAFLGINSPLFLSSEQATGHPTAKDKIKCEDFYQCIKATNDCKLYNNEHITDLSSVFLKFLSLSRVVFTKTNMRIKIFNFTGDQAVRDYSKHFLQNMPINHVT